MEVAKLGSWLVRVVLEPDDRGVDRWAVEFSCDLVRMPATTLDKEQAQWLAETAAKVMLDQAAADLSKPPT